jgi:hypothetical protein
MSFKYGMDNKKFEEQLNSLVELKPKKPKKSPGFRVDENSGGEVRWGNEVISVNEHENPTLNFELVKVKHEPKLCELGCGDIVVNQVIEKRLCITPVRHWRTKCNSCSLFLSPDGLGFVESHNILNAYRIHFSPKNNSEE